MEPLIKINTEFKKNNNCPNFISIENRVVPDAELQNVQTLRAKDREEI